MLDDARRLPNDAVITTDVCIVGAGAAGITLALELIGAPMRICVLESGGVGLDAAAQRLNEGEVVGVPCQPLDESRFRCFGGTTARWTGWCRPLDPIDFETRDWIPHSGWPFTRAHLDGFYERAAVLLQLSAGDVELESGSAAGFRGELDAEGLASPIFRFSPPTRFGDRYRHPIEDAENLRVLLHASAIDIAMSDDHRRVRCVHAGTLDGLRFSVAAKMYILAAGGVENARLLLASNPDGRAGVGNEHGLVGRFFMEHPYFYSGILQARTPPSPFVISNAGQPAREKPAGAAVALGETLLREERLTNAATHFVSRSLYKMEPAFRSPAVGALARLSRGLRGSRPSRGWIREVRTVVVGLDNVGATLASMARSRIASTDWLALRTVAEPHPDPDSRLLLSAQRDPFGRPRARLDWRLNASDRSGARRLHTLLRKVIERVRLGELTTVFDEGDDWPSTLTGGSHHLGTTRMHADPHRGVVDADCRVHGVGNLFVAGSSVFPTAGYANPTMTIVALAIRLAEHLKEIMR